MLPPNIQSQLEDFAKHVSLDYLKSRVERFQDRYQNPETKKQDPITDEISALAYALCRMPATYTVADKIISEFLNYKDSTNIKTCLDVGSGTGAIILALQEMLENPIITGLERNPHMAALAKELSPQTRYINQDIRSFKTEEQYDLVTIAYVLNEIPSDDRKGILKTLWDITNDSLIIIETGTPRGFGVILEARDFIVKQGGYILAPCTHAFECPLSNNSDRWCHFEKRVARTKLHKDLKQDAVRGYEDEPYSYLIATKLKSDLSQKNRLISRVHGEKILSAELCTHEGTIKTITRSKRHDDYKALKKSEWGDLF